MLISLEDISNGDRDSGGNVAYEVAILVVAMVTGEVTMVVVVIVCVWLSPGLGSQKKSSVNLSGTKKKVLRGDRRVRA